MFIDERTRESLLWDKLMTNLNPYSPIGEKLKQMLKPFHVVDKEKWMQVLDEQECMAQELQRRRERLSSLKNILIHIPDLEQILNKLAKQQRLSLTDLFQLKQFLYHITDWIHWMEQTEFTETFYLSQTERKLCRSLLKELNPTLPLRASFHLEEGFHPTLKKLRDRLKESEKMLNDLRHQRVVYIEKTYLVKRNRLGEWVVKKGSQVEQQLAQEPTCRKIRETIYDALYELDDRQLDNELWTACQDLTKQIQECEAEVCHALSKQFALYVKPLQKWQNQIAHFDLQWAKVRLAHSYQGVKPVYDPTCFVIKQGVHPVIKQNHAFTPIDITIVKGMTVIVGPNMGGKTVALRTIGLMALLAQMGFFVPAKTCKFPLFQWITSLIGDYQEVDVGLSSFGGEMVRLSDGLKRKEEGLLLLDEIGRGTNPVEGSALAVSISHYLATHTAWAVHVTHYSAVIKLENIQKYQVVGLRRFDRATHESFGDIIKRHMDYRILPLQAGDQIPHQAIMVAEQLGLPTPITAMARRLMCKQREEE
ncbi:hypothetical protein IC620_06745 [Hazenella sp. IB182357]|uniref:DNA mismatch repair proteins mutS family domain-containing protein n=1 Tax=Polycladospora coralii TaxID=2771432 RepID=A0A926N6H2_9BACL|nr:hypothetical protein [Polycladospora coralii]